MTSKEKAKELVNKFEPYMPFIDQIDYSINLDKRTRHAKHCALILADEVLDNLEDNTGKDINYWQEVKQEIIRL